MANSIVDLVEFRATGLEKIQSGLKDIDGVQKNLTGSILKYRDAVQETLKASTRLQQSIKSGEFRERVRLSDQLARSQERLTRTLERQATLARLTSFAGLRGMGMAGLSMAGNLAGASAAAGFGLGMAGLQGTVPMARLQNQMDRLKWELGNTLTPFVNMATRRVAGAANWLGRQDEGTQDLIGTGLIGGTGLLAANVLSRHAFGAGIGTLGMRGIGLARAGVGMGISALGGGYFTGGSLSGYGPGLGRALLGAAGIGGTAVGAGAGLAFGGYELGATYRNARRMLARNESNDLAGLGGIGDEYNRKFSGLTGNARSAAIRAELGSQIKAERSGIDEYRGTKTKPVAGMVDLVLGWMGISGTGNTGAVNEANDKQTVLRAMLAGKKVGNDHRGNPLVGGDYGEIGSGYYTAASALAKTGYGMSDEDKKAAGIGQTDESVKLLQEIARNTSGGAGSSTKEAAGAAGAAGRFDIPAVAGWVARTFG